MVHNSHWHICLASLSLGSYSSSLSCSTARALPEIQSCPTACPCSLGLSEELVATYCSSPAMRVIPACFHEYVLAFLLLSGLQLLLVAHAVCLVYSNKQEQGKEDLSAIVPSEGKTIIPPISSFATCLVWSAVATTPDMNMALGGGLTRRLW